jgi:hypothetical protein
VAEGGNLASIRSISETDFLYQLCRASNKYCWIGLNDIATEGTYLFVDSPSTPAAGYTLPWSSGQPDNSGNEDCVHFWNAGGATAASINDNLCTATMDFLCKKPAGCPPGQRVSGSDCVACSAGSYSSAANPTTSCTPCPAGRYGSTTGLSTSTCTGPVSAGYYSVSGATGATQYACPAGRYASGTGSTSSLCEGPVAAGWYGGSAETSSTPSGKQCDAGRYGGLGQTASTCSGDCDPGYYCPKGSSSSKAQACGGATVYCPVGSSTATTVSTGYYSKPESGTTRTTQAQCEPGYYCTSGVRQLCPAGRYGSSSGLSSSTCTGACDTGGFLCPAGSTKKTQEACGFGQTYPSEWYCAAGATSRTKVSSGHYSTPLTAPEDQRSGQTACESGFVCTNGQRNAKVRFTGPGQLCTQQDTAAGAGALDFVGELFVNENAAAASMGAVGVSSIVGAPSYSIASAYLATGCQAVGGSGVGSTGHPFATGTTSATSVPLAIKSGVSLDYEACSQYSLVLRATADGSTAKCTITVNVVDLNDLPVFLDGSGAPTSSYSRTIPEMSAQNALVGLPLAASDQDARQELRFSIISGDPNSIFAIGTCSGQISVATTNGATLLDHETNGPTGSRSPHFRLTVQVEDNAIPTKGTRTATVDVTVTDVAEPPKFTSSAYNLAVDENSPTGTVVTPSAGFTATDPDGASSVLTWSLTSIDGDGSGGSTPFTIVSSTGQVKVNTGAKLNYERRSAIRVKVRVTDGVFATDLEDTITINNVNDPPTFTGKQFLNGIVKAELDENRLGGTLVVLPGFSHSSATSTSTPELTATDEDGPTTFTWGVEGGGTSAVPFEVTNTGEDGPRLALTTHVGSSGYDFETLRAQAISSPTSTLYIDDSKSPSVPVVVVTVTVADASGAVARIPFHVTIRNVNEAPVIKGDSGSDAQAPSAGPSQASITREIAENAPVGTPLVVVGKGRATAAALAPGGVGLAAAGVALASDAAVIANDVDLGQSLFFSIVASGQGQGPPYSVSPSGLFDIEQTTGVIRTLQALNFEDTSMGGPQYTVRVRVCDNGAPSPLCDEADVRVNVLDVNESPTISIAQLFLLPENSLVDAQVLNGDTQAPAAAVAASDPDASDAGGLQWSIVTTQLDVNGTAGTPLFKINPTTGVLAVAAGASGLSSHWTTPLNFEATPLRASDTSAGASTASSVSAESRASGNYFRILVQACDGGTYGSVLCTQERVVVALTDQPEAPRVVSGQSRSVPEQTAAGARVGSTPLRAEDQDAGDTATLAFRDATTPESTRFDILPNGTVVLQTAAPSLGVGVDQDVQVVQVIVRDSTNRDSPAQDVSLIVNANNFPPQVTSAAMSIPESATMGTVVGRIQATDQNPEQVLTYFADSFSPTRAKSLFRVVESNGDVVVAAPLNFEDISSVIITALVQDNGPGKAQGIGSITVNIQDVPEPPVITGPSVLLVSEVTPGGEGPNPVPPLGATATSANIVALYEPNNVATELKWMPANAPAGSLPPGYTAKAIAATVNATDPDIGQTATLTFSISPISRATTPAKNGGGGGYTTEDLASWGVTFPLAVHPSTGALFMVAGGIDYERLPSAEPWVSAFLTARDTASLSTTSLIRVWVLDVNERCTATAPSFEVSESAGVGTALSPRNPDSTGLRAVDPDSASLAHSRLLWTITAGNEEGRFAVDPASGRLSVAAPVDWEDRERYTLTLTVTDTPTPTGSASAGGRVLPALTATVTTTITVKNEPDMRVDRVYGATVHGTKGGEWVYFEGANLGPTQRKLDAMLLAQSQGAGVQGGVAFPRVPALASASGLAFTATNGPDTGREFATPTACERPVGVTNNTIVRCKTGESLGVLRWVLTTWHVAKPTAAQEAAAKAAALAGPVGEDEDVYAPGLPTPYDEAATSVGATRTRQPVVNRLTGASSLPTYGGQRFRLNVTDAGPSWLPVTSGGVRYVNGDGTIFDATNCSVTVPHEEISCNSVVGFGGSLVWLVKVGGQTSPAFAFGSFELPVITGLQVTQEGAGQGSEVITDRRTAMSTRGGELVIVQGSGFGPVGTTVSAVYAGAGYDGMTASSASSPPSGDATSVGGPYSARSCYVAKAHTTVHCVTAPGVGRKLYWNVKVGTSAGALKTGLYQAAPASYERPRVIGISGAGAFRASTEGNQPLILSGSSFGPSTFAVPTNGDVAPSQYTPMVYYGPSTQPMRYTASNCRVDGDSHGRIVCNTVAGTGSGFVYTAVLAAFDSAAYKPDGPLGASAGYAPPVVSSYSGDGEGNTPKGSTEGGDLVEILGKNFGPAGSSGLESVGYGHLGQLEFTGKSCTVVSHSKVRCLTDEGAGEQLQWTVVVDSQKSESPSTSYGVPTITGFASDGSVNASTRGGETIELIGTNFGPTTAWAQANAGKPHSFLEWVKYGPTGAEYTAKDCQVLSHTQLRCTTVPGSGGSLVWRVKVQGQVSEPSPPWSYRLPTVVGVVPPNGDSSGNFRVTIVGTDFAVADNFTRVTVTIGDSPRELPTSNRRTLSPSDPLLLQALQHQSSGSRLLAGVATVYEAVDVVVPGGTGRALSLVIRLRMSDESLGTSAETVAPVAITFRYDPPVIEYVSIQDNSREIPGSVLLLLSGKSFGSSAATGRVRLAYTYVEPKSWSDTLVTVVSTVLEGNVHLQVWRGDPQDVQHPVNKQSTLVYSPSVVAGDTSAGGVLPDLVASESSADWIESNGMLYSQRQPQLSPDMLAMFGPGSSATQPTVGGQELVFDVSNVGASRNLTQVLIGPTQITWLDRSGIARPVFPVPRDNVCAQTADPELVNSTAVVTIGQLFRIRCTTPPGQGQAVMHLQVLYAGSTSLDPSQPVSVPYFRPTFTGAVAFGTPTTSVGQWVVSPVPGIRNGVYMIEVPTRGRRITLQGSNFGLIGFIERFVTADHPDENAIMPAQATPGTYSSTLYAHTSATFDIPPGVAHAGLSASSPALTLTPPGAPYPAPASLLRQGAMNTTLYFKVGHPSFEYASLETVGDQTFAATILLKYAAPTLTVQQHSSSTQGGAVLTVSGTNFGESVITPPRVFVNGNPCVVLNSAGAPWMPGNSRQYTVGTDPHATIRCLVPEGAGRDRPIHVAVGQQSTFSTSATEASVALVHYDPPVITGISVREGPTSGNTVVTLTGLNFGGAQGAYVDLLRLDSVAEHHPGSNPNSTVVDRARQFSSLVSATHTSISFILPPGQGGAKSIRLVVAGQLATTRWAAALSPDHSDGVLPPPGTGLTDTAVNVPMFRYTPPAITSVKGACPTTGCEIIITGTNFGFPVVSGTNIVPSVMVYPPSVITHPSQNQQPFACSYDTTRSVNQSHSHTQITCTMPEGMGSNLRLVVQAGTQVSPAVPFSYLPPEIRLFLPNAPSALGNARLRLRGVNFGTAIAPINITLDQAPCRDAELLTPHTQAVCTAPKMTVGAKNVTVSIAWQQRTFDYTQRLVAFECPPRFYGQVGEECLPCPNGAECEGPVCSVSSGLLCTEYIEPYASPGWWRAYERTPTKAGLCPPERQNRPGSFAGACPTFVPCEPAEACLGSNACAAQYTGERCSHCAKGFFRFNGKCSKCPDLPWLAPALICVAVIAVCAAGYTLQKNDQLNIGVFLVSIDYCQVLAIFARSDVQWPKLIGDIFAILSVFNLNIELVNPECIVENIDYDVKFIAVLALPLALASVFLVLHIFRYLYNTCVLQRERERRNEHLPLLIGALWSMTYVLYLVETSQVLSAFNCSPTTPPDGAPYGYLQAVFEPCYVPGGVHQRILPYAWAGLFLYVVAFPLAVLIVLWKNKESVKLDQLLRCNGLGHSQTTSTRTLLTVRQLYSRLYAPFRPGVWWFALALLARKVGVAGVALVFRRNPSFQLGAILVILLISFALQIRYEPWMGPAQYQDELLYHEAKVAEGDSKHARIDARYREILRSLRRAGKKLTMEEEMRKLSASRRKEGAMASAYDLNSLDQFLLASAVFVALAGVCFESTFFEVQGLYGQRDMLTVLVVIVVIVGLLYIGVVIFTEFAEACCPRVADRARCRVKASDRSAIALAAEERRRKLDQPDDMAFNPLQRMASQGDKDAASKAGLDLDDAATIAELDALLKSATLPDASQWLALKGRLDGMKRSVSDLTSDISALKRSESTTSALTKDPAKVKAATSSRGKRQFSQQRTAATEDATEGPSEEARREAFIRSIKGSSRSKMGATRARGSIAPTVGAASPTGGSTGMQIRPMSAARLRLAKDDPQ